MIDSVDSVIKYLNMDHQLDLIFLDIHSIRDSVHQALNNIYKERFLSKTGIEIKSITVNDIAYFFSEDNCTHIRTVDNRDYIIDFKLDELISLLDPSLFFRTNRQLVCKFSSIQKIESYFNCRFIVELSPNWHIQSIVSRERAFDFKSWLDR